MADIILAGDSFSLKKLRNAAEQLEDAQNLMQKVYDAVFSTSFWAEANPFALLDGSKNMNVFDGTIDELHTYQQRVHQKEETLRTLAQRIEAAVRELAETDQSFRGKLSGESRKTTWERFKSTVRILVQPVSTTAILLIGAINGLFSSDAAIGGETRISGFAEAQIANAYRQFDWTDIEPTDEEINEIAANSKNEADLLKQFQTLHADKMRMESEAIYAEFDWRGISVTEEEKTAVIQKASGKNELRMLFEKLYNEKLDAMPPTEIHLTTYTSGAAAEAGCIRYVSQSNDYRANGWGDYGSVPGKASPNGECCTACQSMALSYLGIDASPEKILDTGKHMEMTWRETGYNGEFVRGSDNQATIYANRWNYDDFVQCVDKFENDKNRGITSPVIIRYDGGHFIMIVGRGAEEGTYRAIGPWGGQSGTWERDNLVVRIDSSGKISNVGTNCSHMQHGEPWSVEHLQQYTKV